MSPISTPSAAPPVMNALKINHKMFAYNEDRLAYIKDPTAGTFKQLVMAAEACAPENAFTPVIR